VSLSAGRGTSHTAVVRSELACPSKALRSHAPGPIPGGSEGGPHDGMFRYVDSDDRHDVRSAVVSVSCPHEVATGSELPPLDIEHPGTGRENT
jgi:hypothetical protein